RRRLFLVVALPILIWSYFSQTPASQLMTLLLLVSAYFSIQDVYKIYYDARLQSKRNTLINNLALLLSIGLRLALVSAALPLVWFAVPYILSSAVPYLVRLWLFRGEAAASPRVTP
ncbi:flippase, partial [Serratia marcescens]|nr:flippase [Serratia marcescens]